MPNKILIVDDEPFNLDVLEQELMEYEYIIERAVDGVDALAKTESFGPDLILLDYMMPKMSGLQVVKQLRANEKYKMIPVILLTAKASQEDKIAGLDAGADDYITKPFGMAELLARVRAALRRGADGGTERAEVDTPWIHLDLAAHRAFVGEGHDRPVHLTATEWQIVEHLVRNEGRLVTHRQLITAVWGPSHSPSPSLLRVHMTNIRRKLEPDPGAPTHFTTDGGVGFRFTRS